MFNERQNTPGDDLLTVKEAARGFKVCSETIRRAYQNGHLRVVRVGRHIRIPKQALVDWREAGGQVRAAARDEAA